jgi:hypothetical protein
MIVNPRTDAEIMRAADANGWLFVFVYDIGELHQQIAGVQF